MVVVGVWMTAGGAFGGGVGAGGAARRGGRAVEGGDGVRDGEGARAGRWNAGGARSDPYNIGGRVRCTVHSGKRYKRGRRRDPCRSHVNAVRWQKFLCSQCWSVLRGLDLCKRERPLGAQLITSACESAVTRLIKDRLEAIANVVDEWFLRK